MASLAKASAILLVFGAGIDGAVWRIGALGVGGLWAYGRRRLCLQRGFLASNFPPPMHKFWIRIGESEGGRNLEIIMLTSVLAT
jgi:hypothetical protein